MVAVRKQPARTRTTGAEDARDEFLDVAGHELRTPITALKGHVQLLQRRLRKQAEREQDIGELDKMMYQIERLNHQLDVFLAASHLAHGKFAVLPAETDFATIIQKLLDVYRRGSTGRQFSVVAPDEPIAGHWDRRRIEQAYAALLSNAIKFSPESSEIETRIARDRNGVRLEVSDRGSGVPVAERRRIFEPYAHGGNAENTGPGLGLYIAREAIRRQGGRLGMRSRRGGGSTFWCWLPLEATTTSRPRRIAAKTSSRAR